MKLGLRVLKSPYRGTTQRGHTCRSVLGSQSSGYIARHQSAHTAIRSPKVRAYLHVLCSVVYAVTIGRCQSHYESGR